MTIITKSLLTARVQKHIYANSCPLYHENFTISEREFNFMRRLEAFEAWGVELVEIKIRKLKRFEEFESFEFKSQWN